MPAGVGFGLAQAGDVGSVILRSLILIAVIVTAFVIVMRLRRWMREDESAPTSGFTLSDLRDLHRRGEMSDEEYERARAQIIAGAKAMTDKLPDPLRRQKSGEPERGEQKGK